MTLALNDELESALRVALRQQHRAEAEAPMAAMDDTGLAHLHLRLVGTGLLLRLPKQSQLGLNSADHLRYEACCFERATPCGHTPRLHAVLKPTARLPRGALLVDEIVGRPARLPHDLMAIADTLAALHDLPLPELSQRTVLRAPLEPLRDLLDEIDAQAVHLPAARIAPAAVACITAQCETLRQLVASTSAPRQPPVSLISFDAHPGNFVVRADGRAMLVDLEKARYGPAPLDLAHATLYTSTTWDVHSHAVLSDADVLAFHERWMSRHRDGRALLPWIVPLRRAMWLWSVTWCAKWRVLSPRPTTRTAARNGEDWSSELSEPALVAHVRDRVEHYLSAAVVEQVCDGFDRLHESLS